MKIKFSFKKSFIHRIYVYLCLGIVVPIFLCAAVELRTNPGKKERFAIFVGADLKPESTISMRIGDYFKEYNDKKVTLAACDPTNTFFASHYGSEGLLSDIVILPPSAFKLVDLSIYINIQETNEFYSDSNYISDDGKHLGILFGDGQSCPWNNDITYRDEKYYIFVSSNTVHGQYFQDDYQDDQAISFIRKVLNER